MEALAKRVGRFEAELDALRREARMLLRLGIHLSPQSLDVIIYIAQSRHVWIGDILVLDGRSCSCKDHIPRSQALMRRSDQLG